MKDHKKNKAEEIVLEDLFNDLNRLDLPVVKMELKESFKEDLKSRLLFEFSRKKAQDLGLGKETLFSKFFRTFKSALVTAVILPFLVLGGVSGYAYSSPQIYNGNVLYPLKVSIEALEISLKKEPKDRVETKLKFAERKLDEVLAMKNDGKEIAGVTLKKVADYTLSALQDVKEIKEEKEKDDLKQKINQFSDRQMQMIASLSNNGSFSLNQNYLTFENEEAIPVFDVSDSTIPMSSSAMIQMDSTLADSASKSLDSLALTQLESEQIQTFSAEPNLDTETENTSEKLEEYPLAARSKNVNSNEQVNLEQMTMQSELVNPEAEKTDEKKEKGSSNMETKNTLLEMKDLAKQVLETKKVALPTSSNLTKGGEEEALGYIWNVTNQIKVQEGQDNVNTRSATPVNLDTLSSFGQNEKPLYYPRLRFIPSFEKYKIKEHEYLLQVEGPFSFSVNRFFIDTLNLEVPASIYDKSIEVYFTQDNSNPFNSDTKLFYAEDQIIQVERSITYKFIAISNGQVSPVYTVQISFVKGVNEETKEPLLRSSSDSELRKVNEGRNERINE